MHWVQLPNLAALCVLQVSDGQEHHQGGAQVRASGGHAGLSFGRPDWREAHPFKGVKWAAGCIQRAAD